MGLAQTSDEDKLLDGFFRGALADLATGFVAIHDRHIQVKDDHVVGVFLATLGFLVFLHRYHAIKDFRFIN